MTLFNEPGAPRLETRWLRSRLETGLWRLGRLLRRVRRSLDAYYSLSDFNERLIYGLGLEPLSLRQIRNGRRGDAVLRLRRMRRRRTTRFWRLG